MKPIRMFGNTAGLAFVMAIALICISGRTPLFSSLDAVLFDVGARLTSKKDLPDDITLITLPVAGADELVANPPLNAELIQFLEKLKTAKPAAAVFMLDGYPQMVVNRGVMQVEERLEQVLAAADKANTADVSDILTYAETFSGPGGLLARTLRENGILVAMKINSRTSSRHAFGLDISPYQTLAAEDPGTRSLLDWLPETARPYEMPAIDASGDGQEKENDFGQVVPLFSDPSAPLGWPLVWKYQNGYLPDLVTLLYQKCTDSADAAWVEKKGVRFDYYLMSTDFSGRLRPMLLSSGGSAPVMQTFPIAGMAFDKYFSSLENKIVLIGSAQDPSLDDAARTLLSMRTEATAHTPIWAIWFEKALILLFAAYLILLLQQLNVGLGIVLSVLLLFLSLAMQWGMLVVKGVWLPAATAMVYLVAGHVLIQFRFHTKGHILKLEKKKHDAFCELGTYYAENRRFDKAFEAFQECIPTSEVLDSLHDLGIEYERRQKLKKALGVFEYIDRRQKDFRGSGKRARQLHEFLEGKVGGGDNGAETVSMPAFELQRTVLGRYEIERELGRGAMGIVYLGHDPKIGRRVAIKTLDLADAESQKVEDHEAVKSRFFREAEAIGRLNHPNIVSVYDVGEEDDLAFIAMDFLTGDSLMVHTDNNNLLPVPTVYGITIQVAEALAYAHSQNVIHRDIKPGNILFNEADGLVKVTDFGIARIMDTTLTSTHTILGSPSFMAPEQLKGSKVDGRADIFSLGVTFFQLLTGQFPFGGSDLATITYKITNEETPDITQLRSGLPKSAKNIIFTALAKKPEDRYQTAAEMAAALRRGAPRGTRRKTVK